MASRLWPAVPHRPSARTTGRFYMSAPQVRHETASKFSLIASNGRGYIVRTYDYRLWSANVPAGTYRAVGAPGCPTPERPFVVKAGKTVKGVVVWFGCEYS